MARLERARLRRIKAGEELMLALHRQEEGYFHFDPHRMEVKGSPARNTKLPS